SECASVRENGSKSIRELRVTCNDYFLTPRILRISSALASASPPRAPPHPLRVPLSIRFPSPST
ncbi:unnamed protein product, partial [Sphenostylis stenocarpa]